MKKIRLLPSQNVEIQIHVSDEMEKDYAECRKMMKRKQIKDCSGCSWKDIELYNTSVCMLDDVLEQIENPQEADSQKNTGEEKSSNQNKNRAMIPESYFDQGEMKRKWRCPRCYLTRTDNLGCVCCPNCGQKLDWTPWIKEFNEWKEELMTVQALYMNRREGQRKYGKEHHTEENGSSEQRMLYLQRRG